MQHHDLATVVDEALKTLEAITWGESAALKVRVREPLDEAQRALRESPVSTDELAAELHGRLDALVIALSERESSYFGLRRDLDETEVRSVRVATAALLERGLAWLDERGERTLRDYEKQRDWSTPVSDIGRKGAFFAKQLRQFAEEQYESTRQKVSDDKHPRPTFRLRSDDEAGARPLELRVFSEHLSAGDTDCFFAALRDEVFGDFVRQWTELAQRLEREFESSRQHATTGALTGPSQLSLSPSPSSVVGLTGALSALASTAVVAAGWHTITWAALNVLPGAGLVAALAYMTYAWKNADEEREAELKQLRLHLDGVKERYRLSVLDASSEALRQEAQRLAGALRSAVSTVVLGIDSRRKFQKVVRALETARRAISSGTSEDVSRGRAARLARQCRERLDRGDVEAGALLAAVAFEESLVEWGRMSGVVGGPRREGLIYEVIEAMHVGGIVDVEARRRLHGLRRFRNRIVHDLASLTDDGRAQGAVRDFAAAVVDLASQRVPRTA